MSFEALVTTFVTLFVVIDPIAVAPLFVALTQDMSATARRSVARRACLVGFGMLLVFGVAGKPLLSAIGIGLPAFRISGGLLLFLMAVDMLFERRTQRREKRAAEDDDRPDPSVFPLATPLIAGPGALTTMILLAAQNAGDMLAQVEIQLVMALVVALTYGLCLMGGVIGRLLGHTGIVVLTRIFGILLAALSVQFVLNGLHDLGLLPG